MLSKQQKDRLCATYYRLFPQRTGARGIDSWFFFGPVDDIDWGALAYRNASEHLQLCMEALGLEEEGLEEIESPACAPFCGCDICVVREVIYGAWGTIANATRAGVGVEYSHEH